VPFFGVFTAFRLSNSATQYKVDNIMQQIVVYMLVHTLLGTYTSFILLFIPDF